MGCNNTEDPRDSRTSHSLLPEGHRSRALFCNLKFLGHETGQNCFLVLDPFSRVGEDSKVYEHRLFAGAGGGVVMGSILG